MLNADRLVKLMPKEVSVYTHTHAHTHTDTHTKLYTHTKP